jgi:hypothetical protein
VEGVWAGRQTSFLLWSDIFAPYCHSYEHVLDSVWNVEGDAAKPVWRGVSKGVGKRSQAARPVGRLPLKRPHGRVGGGVEGLGMTGPGKTLEKSVDTPCHMGLYAARMHYATRFFLHFEKKNQATNITFVSEKGDSKNPYQVIVLGLVPFRCCLDHKVCQLYFPSVC